MYTRRAGARRAVPRGARRVRPQAAGEGEGREEKKKVDSSTSLVTNGGGSCSGRWRAGGAQNKHLLFTDHGPHSLLRRYYTLQLTVLVSFQKSSL